MLDTGADMPVWCSGIEYLQYLYDAKELTEMFLLGGFGEGFTEVNVYEIHDFKLGDVVFRNLQVAIDHKRRFAYDIILSNTMLSKMDYSIINRNVDESSLRIMYDNAVYSTGIVRHEPDHEYVKRIYSFSEK